MSGGAELDQALSPRGDGDRAEPLCTITARPRRPGRRPRITPQLLGLGVVVLTIIPAYTVSRVTAAHGTSALSAFRDGPGASLQSHIHEVAARYHVPEDLIVAIIEAESEFDPQAVSRRGARGLMQLMPATARILGVSDPFDPRQNIEAGVRHLRGLMNHFGEDNLPLALAAYNAGPRTVVHYKGIPPYRETREYVNRILRRLDRERAKSPEKGRPGRDA